MARQAGLRTAWPGERPGTSPRGPAFGRPRLGSQAGRVAEAAGPVPAQSGRAGRAPARGLRPQAGPSLGQAGHAALAEADGDVAGDRESAAGERGEGGGKDAIEKRSSP